MQYLRDSYVDMKIRYVQYNNFNLQGLISVAWTSSLCLKFDVSDLMKLGMSNIFYEYDYIMWATVWLIYWIWLHVALVFRSKEVNLVNFVAEKWLYSHLCAMQVSSFHW